MSLLILPDAHESVKSSPLPLRQNSPNFPATVVRRRHSVLCVLSVCFYETPKYQNSMMYGPHPLILLFCMHEPLDDCLISVSQNYLELFPPYFPLLFDGNSLTRADQRRVAFAFRNGRDTDTSLRLDRL